MAPDALNFQSFGFAWGIADPWDHSAMSPTARRAITVTTVLALYACDSSAATAKIFRVSGKVATSCPGPILAGQPRRCLDRAVYARNGRRVTVHGNFSIELRRGTYRVSVDTCPDQQTLVVKHRVRGLKLVPRCPIPL
jgi:hypothetical protein